MKAQSKSSVKLREKPLANGTKSLYLDIYHDGKRKYEFLKLYLNEARTAPERELNRQTLEIAEAVRSKRLLEIHNGVFGLVDKQKQNTPLMPYFLKFVDNVRDNGSYSNLKIWAAAFQILCAYCDENTTFREVDRDFVEGFKNFLDHHRKGKNQTLLSHNTKNSYFTKFKTVLHEAVKDKMILDSRVLDVKGYGIDDTERVFLTMDEVKRLARTECKYPIIKRAFLFSCLSGLRKSDIEKLTWGEVHGNQIAFRQKKTSKQQYLPLNEQAVELLGKRGKATEKVFDGFHYNAALLQHLKEWCMAAGITKDVTFHSARHSFAILMVELGADIYTISKLLGHTKIETTQIYAKVLDKQKQEAVNLMPNINE